MSNIQVDTCLWYILQIFGQTKLFKIFKYSSGLGFFKYLITYVSDVRKVYFINSIEHMLWKYSRGIFVQPFRKNCFKYSITQTYDSNIRVEIWIKYSSWHRYFKYSAEQLFRQWTYWRGLFRIFEWHML